MLYTGKNIDVNNSSFFSDGGFVAEINYIAEKLGEMTLVCPVSAKTRTAVGKKNISENISVIPLYAPCAFIWYPVAILQYFYKIICTMKKNDTNLIYVPSITPAGAIALIVCVLKGGNAIICDRGSIVSVMRNSGEANSAKGKIVYLWNIIWEWTANRLGRRYLTYIRGKQRCEQRAKHGGIVKPLIGSAQEYPSFNGNAKRKNSNFVYIGRIEKAKGVYDLLEAFSALSKDFPDAELHLVGADCDNGLIMQRIRDYGISNQVAVHGLLEYGPELFKVFDLARCTVLPSYSEGVPNVLLEGMAAGTLVIGTDIGGIPDIIDDCENGFLVPAGKPVMLEEVMRKMILLSEDKFLGMQAAAFKKVASWTRQKSFPAIIDELIKRRDGTL